MNTIITNGKDYFCGWDILGNMKFVPERRLAYRMQLPIAKRTLDKINSMFDGYSIVSV